MSSSLNVKWFRRAERLNHWIERSGVKNVPFVRDAIRGARKRLFPGDRDSGQVIVSTHGVTLAIPGRYYRNYVEREYEPVTTRVFLDAIRPGAVVVDVGANIGYYTCLGGRAAGPRGTVHAIEPAAENLGALRANVARNDLGNVIIHDVAAAAAAGERAFNLTSASGCHGFYEHPLADTVETVTVQTRPVDELVSGRADVIKIDAEGAELEVLEGLRALLARSSGSTVIVEWNPHCLTAAGRDPSELPALLRDLGLGAVRAIDDYWDVGVLSLDEVEPVLLAGDLAPGRYVSLYGTVA